VKGKGGEREGRKKEREKERLGNSEVPRMKW
jgi:hypothetical protein